jgi:hypothetical protein
MLSPFFPQWLAALVAPISTGLFKLLPAIPSTVKPALALAIAIAISWLGCLVVTGSPDPLTNADIWPQALALVALAMTGYTLARPVDDIGAAPRVGLVASLIIAMVLLSRPATAQVDSTGTFMPVQETATVLSQILIAMFQGVVARLLKKIHF